MSAKDRKLRDFEQRGDDILAAALSLFATDSWEEVTVEQIAKQAEVGKGTIYKHFSSKYEIYAQLAMNFQSQIIDKFNQIDPSLPVLERFRLQLQAAWDVHLSSRELHRVFLYCSQSGFRANLPTETLLALEKIDQEFTEPAHQLVTEGIEQGIFPNQPFPLLMFGAQAAFWGGTQLVWSDYLSDINQQDHLQALSNFIIAGLTNRNS